MGGCSSTIIRASASSTVLNSSSGPDAPVLLPGMQSRFREFWQNGLLTSSAGSVAHTSLLYRMHNQCLQLSATKRQVYGLQIISIKPIPVTV